MPEESKQQHRWYPKLSFFRNLVFEIQTNLLLGHPEWLVWRLLHKRSQWCPEQWGSEQPGKSWPFAFCYAIYLCDTDDNLLVKQIDAGWPSKRWHEIQWPHKKALGLVALRLMICNNFKWWIIDDWKWPAQKKYFRLQLLVGLGAGGVLDLATTFVWVSIKSKQRNHTIVVYAVFFPGFQA